MSPKSEISADGIPPKVESLLELILPERTESASQLLPPKSSRAPKSSSIGRGEGGSFSFRKVRKTAEPRGSQVANALNAALEEAAASKDPLRWLLVYMRTKVIRMSCNRYAEELGMQSHSLVTKEKKGLSDNPLAATYYRHFQDWERRAKIPGASQQTFKKAIRALNYLLIKEEEGTPARLLTEWQAGTGAEKFAAVTGLDPSKMYLRRKYGEYLTFGTFLKLAKQLDFIDETDSAKVWNNYRIKEARRVCFHDGRRQGRTASSLQISFALEVAGIEFNLSSLQ